jgi:ectoine hydroxylase-related dioxygenase (phytanoyl-CoA dioxygenase family)
MKFRNKHLDAKLKEFGYAKINNQLLNDNEIKTILEKYNELFINEIDNNITYIHLMEVENKDKLKEFSNFLIQLIQNRLEQYINNIQILFGTLLIKKHNIRDFVNHHQDPTLSLSENYPNTYTCWIPLQDVDIKNSCMGFINKSHQFYNYIKPAPYPAFISPIQKYNFSLLPYTNFVPLKVGQAVLFNSNTFHCSLPNQTEQIRYAITFWIIDSTKPISFFYLKPNCINTIQEYKIDTDFFYKYDNSSLYSLYQNGKNIPDYPLNQEIRYNKQVLSKSKLLNIVKKNGNKVNIKLLLYLLYKFPKEFIKNIFIK